MKRFVRRALIELALPIAVAWVKKQEALILRRGMPLAEPQLNDARRVGISRPEEIRVLLVETIPPQLHPLLRLLARQFGLAFSGTIGMALGRGIFLHRQHHDHRALLLHELAHVAQYQRLGLRRFLREYVDECLSLGYPLGPLEAEARQVTHRLSA